MFDLDMRQTAGSADKRRMTALSVFERRVPLALPECERCQEPAWADTPGGLRCEKHAIAEVQEAVSRGDCDWVPRILRRRHG
jgi:hypothetical protein